MRQLLRCGPESFRQTTGQQPVSIVPTAHDCLFINQVLNNMTTDFLVKRTQTGVEKDPAEGTNMLAGPIMMLNRPFFEGFTLHRSRHHSFKETLAIKRSFFLLLHVTFQLPDEFTC